MKTAVTSPHKRRVRAKFHRKSLEVIKISNNKLAKYGHWEKLECQNALEKLLFSAALKCSECRKWKFENVLITQKFYYCPNCGAKMDRGEENGLDRIR